VKTRILIAVCLLGLVLAVPALAHALTVPEKYRGNRIVGVRTKKKVVAFDFDDGPANSGQIIDIMAARGGKPTFFWIGSHITSAAAEYAVAHGAELAGHGWQHRYLLSMGPTEMRDQIVRTDRRIAQFTGSTPMWFRAPYNATSPRMLDLLARTGHLYAHYYVMTRDYDATRVSASDLVKMLERPRPGAIYLFHERMANTVAALPTIMRNLERKGYRVVTNTELLRYGPPVTALP
jgi:peptidoglycan-N-acetylglucosamine deacetylase